MVPLMWKFPTKNHGFVERGVFSMNGGWDYIPVSMVRIMLNPQKWMVYHGKITIYKWMMTGGTPS